MGIKDEVLTLIRDDYNQNGNYSFLYKYILNHNDKLKMKLQANPENKRESIVRKYIQDTMNNYGYPLSYKESTKEKTSDPPLEMIDAWYKYYSEKTDGAGNTLNLDLPLEEFDRFYKSICKSPSSDSILIPIRVDERTGAGLYIIGRDYYTKGNFKYPDSYHCGIDYISSWENIENIGVSIAITYGLEDCDSVIEANRFFEADIILDVDGLEEFHKMNGNMPENCPKELQKYFKGDISVDEW